ncbi:hypothetical protein EYZ11_009855 [Aspergillus tanneri]|uniref:Uncharacterized protein n=1 Tax=Aspergillus tanneri TaxID=1220188 RepID=A0A4S3J706_9EURO|nr:hypothetical protein EYZ11_009855 [Aspergillus tanneri]
MDFLEMMPDDYRFTYHFSLELSALSCGAGPHENQ